MLSLLFICNLIHSAGSYRSDSGKEFKLSFELIRTFSLFGPSRDWSELIVNDSFAAIEFIKENYDELD